MLTRDDAMVLMRRLMDRFERDGAVHLDSGVEELMMGWQGLRPAQPPQAPAQQEKETELEASRAARLAEVKRLLEQMPYTRLTPLSVYPSIYYAVPTENITTVDGTSLFVPSSSTSTSWKWASGSWAPRG